MRRLPANPLWLGLPVAVAVVVAILVVSVVSLTGTQPSQEPPQLQTPTSTPPPTATRSPFRSRRTTRPNGSIVVRGQEFSLQDYRAVLPREAILPIYKPQFVTPRDADLEEMELVLGVEINGESKAYPVGPLNYREMVIDELGGVPILVSW